MPEGKANSGLVKPIYQGIQELLHLRGSVTGNTFQNVIAN